MFKMLISKKGKKSPGFCPGDSFLGELSVRRHPVGRRSPTLWPSGPPLAAAALAGKGATGKPLDTQERPREDRRQHLPAKQRPEESNHPPTSRLQTPGPHNWEGFLLF